VQEGDTVGVIAQFYNVDMQALMTANNITDPNSIRSGQVLIIPIEAQVATAGPTPTGTAPPPYAAPQLLSPADGAAFFAADDTVTLQWATVDILRENERYFVTVEDVTCNCALRQTFTTESNRLILPTDFRPTDNLPHVFRWTVVVARQTGVDAQGNEIYEPAGETSLQRTFSWTGGPAPASATPTP
jgi:LysM repeat protein